MWPLHPPTIATTSVLANETDICHLHFFFFLCAVHTLKINAHLTHNAFFCVWHNFCFWVQHDHSRVARKIIFCCLHNPLYVCVCVFYNFKDLIIPSICTHENILPFFASYSASLVNATGWYVELVTHYSHQYWHKHWCTTTHTWSGLKHFLVSEIYSFLCDCLYYSVERSFHCAYAAVRKAVNVCSVVKGCCGETVLTFALS